MGEDIPLFDNEDIDTKLVRDEGLDDGLRTNWDRTIYGMQRLHLDRIGGDASGEPSEASYQGRRVIRRDSQINGGVYIGGGPREAIVVDDKKYTTLQEIYDELSDRLSNAQKRTTWTVIRRKPISIEDTLRMTLDIVNKKIPYDEQMVSVILDNNNVGPDRKISLSSFVNRGGVCRHQALLYGYLVEKLIADTKLSGKVSIDRNKIGNIGAHSWVRYTPKEMEVFICDPAIGYIGRLEEADSHVNWDYRRPEDE